MVARDVIRCAIGFGASSRATTDDVVALVRATCGSIVAGSVLATIVERAPLARSVAAALHIDVVTFPASALAEVKNVAVSAVAARVLGTASVAEAAALLALGPRGRLVHARVTGRFCTCAVGEAE